MNKLEEKFFDIIPSIADEGETEYRIAKQCAEITEQECERRLIEFFDYLAKENRLQYNGEPTKYGVVYEFIKHLKSKENG